MINVFKNDVIDELINITELLLIALRNIVYYESEYDMDSYNKEMKLFEMYYSKEKMLLDKIPRSGEIVNDVIFKFKDMNNYNLRDRNNFKYVCARLLSGLNDIFRNLPICELYDVEEDEKYYAEEEKKYNLIRSAVSDNLIVRYIKNLNNCYMVSENIGDNYTFRNLQYYNVFVSRNIFQNFYNSGFNFDMIACYSDVEMCRLLHIAMDEYVEIKNDVLRSSITDYTGILLSNSAGKDDITMLDFYLNLKYCLSQLSSLDLLSAKDEIYDYFRENDVNEFTFGRDILNAFEIEIDKRNDIPETSEEEPFSLNDATYNNLVSLFKLEDELFDKFYSNNFSLVSELIKDEKKILSKIDFESIPFTFINELFTNEMFIYINENYYNKVNLIIQRLYTILPFFKDVFIPSSQTSSSYKAIYRNYLIKNLTDFRDMMLSLESEDIKSVFESIYRDNFFVNSELTDEYIVLNGESDFISPLSDDTVMLESNVDRLEYEYDKNKQVYNFALGSLDYLLKHEKDIVSISDYANFQLQSISFVNAVNELDFSSLQDLKLYLKDNSFIFSALRRDLLKIINLGISNLSSSKVLKINF